MATQQVEEKSLLEYFTEDLQNAVQRKANSEKTVEEYVTYIQSLKQQLSVLQKDKTDDEQLRQTAEELENAEMGLAEERNNVAIYDFLAVNLRNNIASLQTAASSAAPPWTAIWINRPLLNGGRKRGI